jgi:hypothetical protein
MTFLTVLKMIAAAATILTGLVALVRPRAIFTFTGLRVEGGRGITEIRSFLGGALIGVGAAALFFRMPETYRMLGGLYLAAGLVRLVSMFLDDSLETSNVISLVTELVFGVILVFPG